MRTKVFIFYFAFVGHVYSQQETPKTSNAGAPPTTVIPTTSTTTIVTPTTPVTPKTPTEVISTTPKVTISVIPKVSKENFVNMLGGISIIPSVKWSVKGMDWFSDAKDAKTYLKYDFEATKLTNYYGSLINKKIGLKLGFNIDVDDNIVGKASKYTGWLGFKKLGVRVGKSKLKGRARWDGDDLSGYGLLEEIEFDNTFINVDLLYWSGSGMANYIGLGYTSFSLPMQFIAGATPIYDPNAKVKMYSFLFGFDSMDGALIKKNTINRGFNIYMATQDKFGLGKVTFSSKAVTAGELANPAKVSEGNSFTAVIIDYFATIGLMYIQDIKTISFGMALGFNFGGTMIGGLTGQASSKDNFGYDYTYFLLRSGLMFKLNLAW